MYSKGDTILYNPAGVCVISDIREENIIGEDMEYYVLKPVFRGTSTIYVPVDNETLTSRMVSLLSKKEIEKLFEKADSSVKWVEDSKKRVVEYNEILTHNCREDVIQIIRLLKKHKEDVAKTNHKFYATDEKILNTAEKLIGEEIGFVLKMTPEEAVAALG